MKVGSTLFLKTAVVTLGLIVLATCIFGLPAGIAAEHIGGYRQILIGLYVPAIPFFVALYQALKLLDHIEANQAFSESSVNALTAIKRCAVIISALFAAGMPYIYIVAERDDAPGVVLIGLVIVFASTVIATFAAVLQKLVQSAIEIKSENELTV